MPSGPRRDLNRVMLAGLLLGITLVGGFLFPPPGLDDGQVLQERPVRLVTSSNPSIFPASWREPGIAAEGKILRAEEIDRSRRLVNRALDLYPPVLLQNNLRTVYFLSDLKFCGITAGGTNSREDIYLRNNGAKEGFTDEWIEGALHHELSSILLRNFPSHLDQDEWVKFNPPGFEYLGDGVLAVKKNHQNKTADSSLWPDGFLCSYGQASFEEDFNMFAEYLFTGHPELWDAARASSRVAGKLRLVLDFYEQLHAGFTEESFRSLAEKNRQMAGKAGKDG